MGFKDDVVRITQGKKKVENIIKKIKEEIVTTATNGGCYAFRVYKLEAENKYHRTQGYGAVSCKLEDITPTKTDSLIIKTFTDMGFTLSFDSVNLNPNPEVGEEGYSAAFFMNVSWE
jgi:hypothetical protein